MWLLHIYHLDNFIYFFILVRIMLKTDNLLTLKTDKIQGMFYTISQKCVPLSFKYYCVWQVNKAKTKTLGDLIPDGLNFAKI